MLVLLHLLMLHRLLVLRRLMLMVLRLMLDRCLMLRRLLLPQLRVHEQLLVPLLCRPNCRPNGWSRRPILAGPALLRIGRSTGLRLLEGLLVCRGLLRRLVNLLRLHLRGCCCHLHSDRLRLPVPAVLRMLQGLVRTGVLLHSRPLQRLLWLRRWLVMPLGLLQGDVPKAEALQICADCSLASVALLRGLAGWSELLPLHIALLVAAQCHQTANVLLVLVVMLMLVLVQLLQRLGMPLLQRRRVKCQALKVCIEVQCSCSGRLLPRPLAGRLPPVCAATLQQVGARHRVGCCLALRWPVEPRQRTATARCWAAGVPQQATSRFRGQPTVKAGRGAAASPRVADHRAAGGQRSSETCRGCTRALPQLAPSPEAVLCWRCCLIRVPHSHNLSLRWDSAMHSLQV